MNTQRDKQFEYIELVLAYEGLLTNQKIRDAFDVTPVQASRIIGLYREAHPENITLTKGTGRGRYAPSARFSPAVAALSVDAYFQKVAKANENNPVEVVHNDLTQVDPMCFRSIHAAIGASSAVEVRYFSMNHPEGCDRVIHPRHFVFAGRRWHVRGFDELTNEYRDFNLARIERVRPTDPSVAPPKDLDWEQYVLLQIRPHPMLTPPQAKLIRKELFNGAAGRQIRTRKALITYVLTDLVAAEDPNLQTPPEYQIYLYQVNH